MAILTRIIEQLAALMVATGIPAGQSALYALILIYLLVTGVLAGLLIIILLRRRRRAPPKVTSPSDLES
jgi:heme/copper-type cytochrome/quinol oxidase subunit 2